MRRLGSCSDFSELGGYEEVTIQGKTIELPPPDPIPEEPFVGMEEVVERALAAWLEVEGGAPLHFRIYGKPGTGKTSLVFHLARILGKDLYVMNGDDDTRVEDIACVPNLDERNTTRLKFRGSPLLAAMLRGQICFFDEIAKAPSGALAALASVLDARRVLESKMAGIKVKASPGFLFCASLNEDEEIMGGLPEYIAQRTLPAIRMEAPSIETLESILESKMSNSNLSWVKWFVLEFGDRQFSPRTAIKLLEYAIKLHKRSNPEGNNGLSREEAVEYLRKAAKDFSVDDSSDFQVEDDRREEGFDSVYDILQEDRTDPLH